MTAPRLEEARSHLAGWTDVLALVAVAAVIDRVSTYRYDWAAHVVAGGAIVVATAGVVPTRFRIWVGPIGATCALVAGVLAELTLTGPWDPSDVAFTVAGALVVAGETLAAGPRLQRTARWSLGLALGLMAGALAFRYGIRRGP